jgi:predicted RNA-binding protein with PUA-like domain
VRGNTCANGSGVATPRGRRAWVFQASPARYQIEESLQAEREEFWNLRQHAKQIAVGDRVFIWMSGEAAGIYAIGTVTTPPEVRPDSSAGLDYWLAKQEGLRLLPRVVVRYERVLLDRPLRKVFLEADPALWNMNIIRSPRGTNFAVRTDEWRALAAWLDLDSET